MKRLNVHPLLLVLSATILSGQPKPLVPMRGVNRDQPQPLVAILVVGVNSAVGSIAEPGWPLIVGAARLPDDQKVTIPLPSGLRVKLSDANDRDVAVDFESVPRTSTNQSETTLYWLAAETATAQLAPGRYRLTLTAAQGELTGWRVEAGEFQIVAANSDRSRLVGHLKAHRAVLLGRNDEALAEAERLTTANDKDKDAWIAKGDILMLKDQPDEALQAFDRALRLHKKTDREPLAILQRRRAAFFRSLEKRGVIAPPPP